LRALVVVAIMRAGYGGGGGLSSRSLTRKLSAISVLSFKIHRQDKSDAKSARHEIFQILRLLLFKKW
jgi:hypothetical protein